MVRTLRPQGPVLIFGGPYSNLEATCSLLWEARRRGIAPENMICTGDVVAYGADAVATIDLIRKSIPNVIMGNCEENLAAGLADCGCGFPAGSTCERLSSAWFSHAARQLNSAARDWMRQLPKRIDIEIGGYEFAVVHGTATSINDFVFASSPASTKARELDLAHADGIIAGHCGLPFSQCIGGWLWHNPGVIGMPANDGTPRVWFTIITAESSELRIEHCALSYDFAAAAAKMRRAGLPEDYASALETGLWPSWDVLPIIEQRSSGARLAEGSFIWRREPSETQIGRDRLGIDEIWPSAESNRTPAFQPAKFGDRNVTATGAQRATVPLRTLQTIWFNTGTLCNVTCRHCYIESSPRNDRLSYLSRDDVSGYLDEIDGSTLGTEEIGFTGGEPFMNPHFLDILGDCLSRGYRILVLTNAMRPMQRAKTRLLDLKNRFNGQLTLRVSLDHFQPCRHEEERGPRTFDPALDGLIWLSRSGFKVTVAGRTMWGEDAAAARIGYARLFEEYGISINADDPNELVLFPEIDFKSDVPEITSACWGILGKSPDDIMCSSSRMVVKRKGSNQTVVLACTIIPYDRQFELGQTLAEASRSVSLNHPNCARFCVLGGASCSPSPHLASSE